MDISRLVALSFYLGRILEGRPTRWVKILSRITWTISKDERDDTEYTSIYPWIPMKCFEFRMLYSSFAS